MGLLDIFKGKFVDPTYASVHGGGDIITTRLDAVVKWGRKSSLWPMPFGTACCAIEWLLQDLACVVFIGLGFQAVPADIGISRRWGLATIVTILRKRPIAGLSVTS